GSAAGCRGAVEWRSAAWHPARSCGPKRARRGCCAGPNPRTDDDTGPGNDTTGTDDAIAGDNVNACTADVDAITECQVTRAEAHVANRAPREEIDEAE